VNGTGQEWTTLTALQRAHHNLLKPQGRGITGIGMVEWSERLGNAPIYLHLDDQAWVMGSSPKNAPGVANEQELS